jgi:hypothetical protein
MKPSPPPPPPPAGFSGTAAIAHASPPANETDITTLAAPASSETLIPALLLSLNRSVWPPPVVPLPEKQAAPTTSSPLALVAVTVAGVELMLESETKVPVEVVW